MIMMVVTMNRVNLCRSSSSRNGTVNRIQHLKNTLNCRLDWDIAFQTIWLAHQSKMLTRFMMQTRWVVSHNIAHTWSARMRYTLSIGSQNISTKYDFKCVCVYEYSAVWISVQCQVFKFRDDSIRKKLTKKKTRQPETGEHEKNGFTRIHLVERWNCGE